MKNRITRADYQFDLVIITDDGERFSELDAPAAVVQTINEAVQRGQSSGSCFSGGIHYSWDVDDPADPTDVAVQFTRNGAIEDVVYIPLAGWLAFQLCASRRNVDAASWLTSILGIATGEEGMTLRGAIRFLFPRKSDVATRFEEHVREFNRMGVADVEKEVII